MDKRYLVLLSLATATAYGLGEVDLLEAQAKSITHPSVIHFDLAPAAGATLDTFLFNQMCPKVDTAFALPADTCDSVMLDLQPSAVTLVKRDTDDDGMRDTWSMNRHFELPGQFVAD